MSRRGGGRGAKCAAGGGAHMPKAARGRMGTFATDDATLRGLGKAAGNIFCGQVSEGERRVDTAICDRIGWICDRGKAGFHFGEVRQAAGVSLCGCRCNMLILRLLARLGSYKPSRDSGLALSRQISSITGGPTLPDRVRTTRDCRAAITQGQN